LRRRGDQRRGALFSQHTRALEDFERRRHIAIRQCLFHRGHRERHKILEELIFELDQHPLALGVVDVSIHCVGGDIQRFGDVLVAHVLREFFVQDR